MPKAGSPVAVLSFLGLLFLALNISLCSSFRVSTYQNLNQKISLRAPFSNALQPDASARSGLVVEYRDTIPFWSTLCSRLSIETVIHTADCEDYDVNCVQYRKARYWRELSTPEIEEEIRKVRKVLAKIELYRKTRNPALNPGSLRNTRRTLAQLLFIRHERHLRSLREKAELKKSSS